MRGTLRLGYLTVEDENLSGKGDYASTAEARTQGPGRTLKSLRQAVSLAEHRNESDFGFADG
jgi:hypothetical protein